MIPAVEMLGVGWLTVGNDSNGRVLLVVALTVAAAAAGWGLGSRHTSTIETVGTAYSTEFAISVETDDWTYEIPLSVRWRDGGQTWHEGGRPDCLPPAGPIPGVSFAAVPVEVGGLGFRQVVAVFCD